MTDNHQKIIGHFVFNWYCNKLFVRSKKADRENRTF